MTHNQIHRNQIITAIKRAESQAELDRIIQQHPKITLDADITRYLKHKRYQIIRHELS